ncbi:serine/threonine-protein kinase SRPK3 [Xylaria sp. FL1042]|nr:serine/threonine-protein kinase SRPK3 [Xylaria sp. FL1042]
MSSPTTPPPEIPSVGNSRFKSMSTPCEFVGVYRPGGFRPVVLGDVLRGRYRIIRKLGYGSYATVWLADDTIKYVALKIYAANMDVMNESSIQQYLATNSLNDVNPNFILLLSDLFILEGPNGKHPCFVTEPMGPSISNVPNAPHEYYDPLNPPTHRFSTSRNKCILRNVLLGLKLHHQNDILDYVERVDGKVDRWSPKHLLVLEPIIEGLQDRDLVKLADCGNGRRRRLILRNRFDQGVDIWSFGCLMFALLTDRPLFGVFNYGGRPRDVIDDDHLIQLTEVIGTLPRHMRDAWPRYTSYFGSDGERLNATPEDFDDSEIMRIWKAKNPPARGRSPPTALPSLEERARKLTSLLREIFQVESSKRPSVVQLLERPWFQV